MRLSSQGIYPTALVVIFTLTKSTIDNTITTSMLSHPVRDGLARANILPVMDDLSTICIEAEEEDGDSGRNSITTASCCQSGDSVRANCLETLVP